MIENAISLLIFFGGLAVIVSLLSFLLSAIDALNSGETCYSKRQPNQAETDQKNADPVAAAIASYQDNRDSHERKRAKRETITIKVLTATGLFALIAAGASIASGWIFWGQLNEMQAEQRPWVYAVEVIPGGRIILVNGVYAIPLKFSIKNTGRLPAFFVIPKTVAAAIGIGVSTFTIHNDVCDEYRKNPIAKSSGNTVFADQTVSHGGFSSEDYPTVRKDTWDALGRDKMLIVFGCIDYQFPDQPGHHQSRFAFAVVRLVDQGILERIGRLPDDPTTADIRLLPVNIGDEKPPD